MLRKKNSLKGDIYQPEDLSQLGKMFFKLRNRAAEEVIATLTPEQISKTVLKFRKKQAAVAALQSGGLPHPALVPTISIEMHKHLVTSMALRDSIVSAYAAQGIKATFDDSLPQPSLSLALLKRR